MDNLINVYMNYLTKTMVKIALVCFKDEEFVEKRIERFVRTYIDNRYYNIFHTVDDNSTYSLEVLNEEFDGLVVELLDDYSDYELLESNDKYTENVEIIKKLKDFALDVVKIDDLKFNDNYHTEINNIFRKYDVSVKYINKIMKKFVDRSNKFLSLDDSYFTMTYDKISNVDNCKMIKIDHKINLLNNYRWVLIDRVYADSRLNIDKWSVSLQKFSLFLLNEIFNNRSINDKYYLNLDSDFIVRKNLNGELSTLLNNPILKKYLILIIPFDTLKANRELIDSLGYELCVNINLEHISDISVKLDSAVNMKCRDILISGYKERDYEYIKNYRTAEDKSLLIYKEVE